MIRWLARLQLSLSEMSRWPGFWATVLGLALVGITVASIRLGAVSITTDYPAPAAALQVTRREKLERVTRTSGFPA